MGGRPHLATSMSEESSQPPRLSGDAEITDEQLWSWVDREAPELDEYLAAHPEAAERVDELRGAIGQLAPLEVEIPELPERIGAFQIRGLLGRGGMGRVYDALQEDPRRSVALKVLLAEVGDDEGSEERFRREADALARLSHPGIATIYEVGRGEDGRPFIAMERVRGLPLDRFVAEHRPGRRVRLELARRICAAVGHAHDQGVVHRDLKPSNILVDEEGRPRLVDFGLARIPGDEQAWVTEQSQSATLAGTVPYMSPEQIRGRGETLGPAADVYSLGVVLFELFTGELPHDLRGRSLPEIARIICEEPPAFRRRRALRGDLRIIVLKALEKKPAQRYSCAGELAADLRRYSDGRAIEAARTPWRRQLWRFYRRHWLGATLAGVIGVFLVSLVIPMPLPIPLVAGWWREGAPFDDLRWRGDTPEVLIDDRWYGLVAIDDLRSGYVVGYCQQHAGDRWRKRFSEDLVQVLHRLGNWSFLDVDLHLRDLESGESIVLEDVSLDHERRRAILTGRNRWPWRDLRGADGRYFAEIEGVEWELLSVAGLPARELFQGPGNPYDHFCDRLGFSPGETLELELRDPVTGEVKHGSYPRSHRERLGR